jgi:hypothetical protein
MDLKRRMAFGLTTESSYIIAAVIDYCPRFHSLLSATTGKCARAAKVGT